MSRVLICRAHTITLKIQQRTHIHVRRVTQTQKKIIAKRMNVNVIRKYTRKIGLTVDEQDTRRAAHDQNSVTPHKRVVVQHSHGSLGHLRELVEGWDNLCVCVCEHVCQRVFMLRNKGSCLCNVQGCMCWYV
jgi:hypothetical protein